MSISRTSILKFCARLLLYFAVFALAYTLFIAFFGKTAMLEQTVNYPLAGGGHMLSRMRDADTCGNVDIVFVGSSHTYRGFDNRIFAKYGYSSFNLGSSNQTPMQYEVLLKRFLSQMNPRYVVIEVNPEAFEMDGIESSLDLIANYGVDFPVICMALKSCNMKAINTAIYGLYADHILHDKRFVAEPAISGADCYVSGGFVARDSVPFKYKNPIRRNFEIRNSQRTAFENSLKFLSENNVKVLLVEAPVMRVYYDSYANHDEFADYMMTKGMYFDFNNPQIVPDYMFYDLEHMYQSGVELFDSLFVTKCLPK